MTQSAHAWAGARLIGSLAAIAATACLAALTAPAMAVETGKISNPCVAHAVETPGLYSSLQQMNKACGLPSAAPRALAPPTPGTASSEASPLTSTPCDYCTYYIYSGDSENVINAKGCSTNTVLITYPVSSGCEGGANEKWEIVPLSTGYRALIAHYGGAVVCMTAGGESGQNAGAQVCTEPVQSYMEFRRPVVSESCYSGWYYIIPANNWGLTLNVRGGLGQGRNIISYPQSCAVNSIWYYG